MIAGVTASFKPESIRAVISDLMCTLFNPGMQELAVQEWATHLAHSDAKLAQALVYHEQAAGLGTPELIEDWMERVLDHAGLPVDSGLKARQYAHKLGSISAKHGQPYPHTRELIQAVRKQRKFSVLSTVSHRGRLAAKNLGFDKPWVDDAVFSSEVHDMKPSPSVYQLACERLSLPPDQCLFVDDHYEYASAASQLGITAVVVLHAEGHTASMIADGTLTRQELSDRGIITIDRIEEIGELLELPNWPPTSQIT